MKTIANLYVDYDVKAKAQALNINMSQLFNQMLELEVFIVTNMEKNTPEEKIKLLKQELALSNYKLSELTKERDKLKKDS